ncbi:hypothetical protein ACVBEQ_00880 [Nakamurella sp. GG22]
MVGQHACVTQLTELFELGEHLIAIARGRRAGGSWRRSVVDRRCLLDGGLILCRPSGLLAPLHTAMYRARHGDLGGGFEKAHR